MERSMRQNDIRMRYAASLSPSCWLTAAYGQHSSFDEPNMTTSSPTLEHCNGLLRRRRRKVTGTLAYGTMRC